MFKRFSNAKKLESSDNVLLVMALLLAVNYIDSYGGCAYCKYQYRQRCPKDSKNSKICKYGIFCGFMKKANEKIKEAYKLEII